VLNLDYRITVKGIVELIVIRITSLVVVGRITAVIVAAVVVVEVACTTMEQPCWSVVHMVILKKLMEPYLDLHRMLAHNLVSVVVKSFHTEVFLGLILVFCFGHLSILSC